MKKLEKEINASVAIQVLPKVKNNEELIKVVDEIISYIKSKNLKTHVGPFETTIEGNYEELMEIVKQCQLLAIEAGAEGAMSYVKISYRPNGDLLTIDEKINKHL